MITEAEKQKRQKEWDMVVTNSELSLGSFKHKEKFDEVVQDYINGKISFEESQKRWLGVASEIVKSMK